MTNWYISKHLLFALFVILLIGDDGLCGPKKRKPKKSGRLKDKAGESSSIDAKIIVKRIGDMKIREADCFYELDKLAVFATEIYLRQIEKARTELDNKFTRCNEVYESAITTRLEQLGLVGDAIRIWMEKMNDFALLDLNSFISLRFQNVEVRKIDSVKRLFEINIEEPEGLPSPWIPFGSERPNEDPSSVSEEEKTRRFKETLLWRAYHMGGGICVHLKEHPLWSIYRQVNTARRFSAIHFKEDNIQLLEYEKEVIELNQFKRLSLMGQYLGVRYLCSHLNKDPTPTRVAVVGKSPSDYFISACRRHPVDSLRMFGLDGELSLFVETSDCDIKKFYRMRESIRCLVRIELIEEEEVKKDLATLNSMGNRLVTGCLEHLEDEIQRIMGTITSSSAYDEALEEFLDLLGDFLKKDYFVYSQHSMEQGLAVRAMEVSDVEMNFFLREHKFDKFDILQAYLDGTKMCDLFKTPEWKHFMNTPNKLLEFYEVFAEFNRTQKFRLEGYAATHPAMTLYVLANMCRSIEIIPFPSENRNSLATLIHTVKLPSISQDPSAMLDLI